MMNRKKLIFQIIGFVLMLYVLSNVDWRLMRDSFKVIEFRYFVLAFPMCLACLCLKAVRWLYIVRTQGIELSLWDGLVFYVSSFFWSLVTPGKVGQFTRVLYIKKIGVSTGKAVLGVLIENFFDVFSAVALLSAGLLVFMRLPLWTIMVDIVLCVSMLFVFKKLAWLIQKIINLFARFMSAERKEKIGNSINGAVYDLSKITFPRMAGLTIITVFSWLLFFTPLFLFSNGMGFGVSPFYLFAGIIFASIIALIPVSVSGIGTREAFFILYLGQAGISKEKALLFSLICLCLNLILMAESYLIFTLNDSRLLNWRRKWEIQRGL